MSNDANLITFKAIHNFVTELNKLFGSKHRPLKRYDRLIKQTTIAHEKVIEKHISTFKTFSRENRNAIKSQDSSALAGKITYSTNAYIDIKAMFGLADKSIAKDMWKHLLTITALVDPASKCKEILRANMKQEQDGNNNETEFIGNIIEQVEQNVDPDVSPMEALGAIMNSGVFTDLISGMTQGMQNGELDMEKMMGAVQGIVAGLGEQVGDDPQAQQAMGMVSSMMTNMSNMSNQPTIEEVSSDTNN